MNLLSISAISLKLLATAPDFFMAACHCTRPLSRACPILISEAFSRCSFVKGASAMDWALSKQRWAETLKEKIA